MNEKDTPYNSSARLIKSMKFNLTRSHHISTVIIGNGVAADIVQLNASSATNKSVTRRSMLHESSVNNLPIRKVGRTTKSVNNLPIRKVGFPSLVISFMDLTPPLSMNLG